MQAQASVFSNYIFELYAQVSTSGRLTRSEKVMLESALSKESTSKEEKVAIQRLLYALRRGYFKLVDS